jgi:hypothetical protein
MNSHHVFRWLFAMLFVCASITQSKAIAQTKCSENQFKAKDEFEELLRSGADVNIKAKDGRTALSLVKKNYIENSPIEQLLRQFGAIE